MNMIHLLALAVLSMCAALSCRAQDIDKDTLDGWLASMPSDTARAEAVLGLLRSSDGTEAERLGLEPRLDILLDRIGRSNDPAVRRKGKSVWAFALLRNADRERGLTNYTAGLRHARSAWQLVRTDATPDEALAYYGMLAQLYAGVGDKPHQAHYAALAIPHARAAADTANLLYFMLLVAEARPEQGDLDGIQRLGDRFFKGISNEDAMLFEWSMTKRLMDKGQDAEALTKLKAMMARRETLEQDYYYALYHWTLGELYSKLDSIPQGIHAMEKAIELAMDLDRTRWTARERVLLGDLLERAGRTREAEQQWLQAVGDLRAQGLVNHEIKAVESLKDLYSRQGRYEAALRMTERWIVLNDSVSAMDAARETMLMEFEDQAIADSTASALQLRAEQEQAEVRVSRERTRRNIFLFAGMGVLIFAAVVYRQRNRISKERQRSEELLLNILPEEVAEELKAKGEAQAVHFDQVTVLFTDFKGFTAMSEVLTPKELVRDLHECFSAFDHICEKHGLEKIKTIGDAYMAAGGLPTPNTTHALDVIRAALEMRDFIAQGKAHKIAAGLPYFEIRIGVHTGPVVAGIVGVKKFQYDIWGDTVNTASRMESSGEVGQVNISEATYALVKDAEESPQLSVVGPQGGSLATDHSELTAKASFTFTPRGKVQAKGKGELEMYFVQRGLGEG